RESDLAPLTGLLIWRALQRRLDREFSLAFDTGSPLSVILGDVDFFKVFNDQHGHETGDRVLKLIAGALREHLRPRDAVGRYGGAEFVIMLPNPPPLGAAVLPLRTRPPP